MRYSSKVMLAVLLCFIIGLLASATAMAADKYVLAYIREMGKYEAATCNGGGNKLVIRVFDEAGQPVPNVAPTHTTPLPGGNDWGATGSLDSDHPGVFSIQAAGAQMPDSTTITMSDFTTGLPASDVSPMMTSHRYWCGIANQQFMSGYELGYMYKSDANNAGTFDTSLWGTWNTSVEAPNSGPNTAPYTKSLAYNSINYNNSETDTYSAYNNGSRTNYPFMGQTFVANGDRIMAIGVRSTMNGVNPYRLYCQVYKASDRTPICDPKYIDVNAQGYPLTVFTYGVNECPVVNGTAYYVRFWSYNNNIQVQVVNDVYGSGSLFVNTANYPADSPANAIGNDTAVTSKDIAGFVCCMTYGSTNLGNIHGTVKDDLGNAVGYASVSIASLNKSIYAKADGTFDFFNVAPGAYSISADRVKNCAGVGAVNVTNGTTANVIVTCNRAQPNKVANPGFETNNLTNWPSYWTTSGTNPTRYTKTNFQIFTPTTPGGNWAAMGSNWGGHFTQAGGGPWGDKVYQVVTGLTAGQIYNVGAFISTFTGGSGDWPTRNWVKLGYDLAGGTDGATGIWSGDLKPFGNDRMWQFVKYTFTATGPNVTVYLEFSEDNSGQISLAGTGCRFDEVCVEQCSTTPGGAISEVLKQADGSAVAFQNMIVTAGYPAFNNAFYIEDSNRIDGIRVASSTTQYEGDKVNITGTVGTDPTTQERVINATSVSLVADYQTTPEPLAIGTKAVGGADFGQYTLGVYNGTGLYNVGMLVTVYGKVTYRGAGFFYLDDGGLLNDGNGVTAAKGVRIDTNGLTNPTQGHALVTGIITKKDLAGHKVRMIRPIDQARIIGY